MSDIPDSPFPSWMDSGNSWFQWIILGVLFYSLELLAIAVSMKVIEQEVFKRSKSSLFEYLNAQANDIRTTVPLVWAFRPIVCSPAWVLNSPAEFPSILDTRPFRIHGRPVWSHCGGGGANSTRIAWKMMHSGRNRTSMSRATNHGWAHDQIGSLNGVQHCWCPEIGFRCLYQTHGRRTIRKW
jgi:hypothetical protein